MTEPQPPTDASPSGEHAIHPLEAQRRENRQAICNLGLAPYGRSSKNLISLAAARQRYDEAADQAYQQAKTALKELGGDAGNATAAGEQAERQAGGLPDQRPRIATAGRVVLKRDSGRLIWMQLRDHSTGPAAQVSGAEAAGPAMNLAQDLQIAVSKKDVAAPGFEVARLLDLGDIVVVEGPLMRTNRGEVTLWAERLELAAKSLAPPPEKWSGLQDIEQRYRRRYVDLYANPHSMQVALLRSAIMQRIRSFLAGRGFVEVETPILQAQAGGAAARPFATHMHALDIPLFMRIAPELFLKRLLVGGMPRVFEINRNFRNEGLDKQHNPEFTMLELYEAFGDVESVMQLTEELVRDAARLVAGEGQAARLPFADGVIDYEQTFARVSYSELFARGLGFSPSDEGRVRKAAEERGILARWAGHLEQEGKGAAGSGGVDVQLLVNELFEEVAEKTLNAYQPTWIMQYPAALSPLTRPNREHPQFADRSDLFIGGMEIGPHYTELNDPDVQAEKFREQLAGVDEEESTFRNYDADFIEALKVGMPPAGGMGLGIDRLCMLLLNQRSIRDVILFPMMRPER